MLEKARVCVSASLRVHIIWRKEQSNSTHKWTEQFDIILYDYCDLFGITTAKVRKDRNTENREKKEPCNAENVRIIR
jgi:hypothetical protein